MTWPQVVLGDVIRVARSGIPPQAIEAGTTYVGLEHIDSEGNFIGVRSVDSGELASTKFTFSDRHVLFGKLRPYLKKTARPDFEGICSTDILPLEPGREMDRDYLFHVLRRQHFVEEVTSLCAGANLPRISPKVLASLKVPLPLLAEQRRIATILDKADALRAKRREAIAKLDQWVDAMFVEIVGDVSSDNHGWPEIEFGDLVDSTKLGLVRSAAEFGDPPAFDVPYIRMDAIGRDGRFLRSKIKMTSATLREREEFSVRYADLLFNTRNSRDLVGKSTVFDASSDEGTFNNNLMRIRFNDKANSFYVHRYLMSRRGKMELERRKSGTTSVFAVYYKHLKNLPVVLPPRRRQDRFRKLVEAQRKARDILVEQLERMDALVQSLQHRAFAGTL